MQVVAFLYNGESCNVLTQLEAFMDLRLKMIRPSLSIRTDNVYLDAMWERCITCYLLLVFEVAKS